MFLIVGLQNPGEKYTHTRHNAGGLAARAFCNVHGLPELVSSAKYGGDISEGVIDGHDVRVLLPTTFMNKSGVAVKKAYDGGADTLIVVYDDLDLPIGSFKVSYGRGSGGHNGVQSIVNALGSKEFVRVRIGISPVSLFGNLKRPTGERAAAFVLANFSNRERAKFDALLPTIIEAIRTIAVEGKEQAMNTYN